LKEAVRAGGDAIAAESKSYEFLISSVKKGSDEVKQLCASYIPEFLHYFPSLAERSLDAQIDMCEDEKVSIRLRAYKGLEQICKNNKAYVLRVADVLGQLLASEDQRELVTIKQIFAALFELDSKQSFNALFTQIKEGEQPLRAKATEFLVSQLAKYHTQLKTNEELQVVVAQGLKQTVQLEGIQIDPKDFNLFIRLLLSFKVVQEDSNFPAELSNLLTKQSGISNDFSPADPASITAFTSGLRTISAPVYKKLGLTSEPYIAYFFGKILPNLSKIGEENRAGVLRAVSLSLAKGGIDSKLAKQHLPALWAAAKHYLPRGETKTAEEKPEIKVDDASAANFALVEPLLFLLHLFGAASPDSVYSVFGLAPSAGQPTDLAAEAKKADFISRITALQNSAKAWKDTISTEIKQFNDQIKQNKEKEKEEERKAIIEKKKPFISNSRIASSLAKLTQPLLAKSPQFHNKLTDFALSYSKAKAAETKGAASSKQTAKKGAKAGKKGQKEVGSRTNSNKMQVDSNKGKNKGSSKQNSAEKGKNAQKTSAGQPPSSKSKQNKQQIAQNQAGNKRKRDQSSSNKGTSNNNQGRQSDSNKKQRPQSQQGRRGNQPNNNNSNNNAQAAYLNAMMMMNPMAAQQIQQQLLLQQAASRISQTLQGYGRQGSRANSNKSQRGGNNSNRRGGRSSNQGRR
jgi:hypothetical protein